MSFLSALGMAIAVCAVAGGWTGRLKWYQVDGLNGLSFGLYSIDSFQQHDWLWALFWTAACAFFTSQWWKGGGGDDTKRRLRRWAKAFTPVRRTAPAMS